MGRRPKSKVNVKELLAVVYKACSDMQRDPESLRKVVSTAVGIMLLRTERWATTVREVDRELYRYDLMVRAARSLKEAYDRLDESSDLMDGHMSDVDEMLDSALELVVELNSVMDELGPLLSSGRQELQRNRKARLSVDLASVQVERVSSVGTWMASRPGLASGKGLQGYDRDLGPIRKDPSVDDSDLHGLVDYRKKQPVSGGEI